MFDNIPQHGSTPLHSAVEGGHAAAIELLVALGAQLEARGHSGDTPLLKAVELASDTRNVEAVATLLAAGANASAQNAVSHTVLVI